MCEFYNHFGGTVDIFEVHNFCEFLKTHFGRCEIQLLSILEKNQNFPDWSRNDAPIFFEVFLISALCVCSVHVHPVALLPVSGGDSGAGVLAAHRHVVVRLHPGRTLHRLPHLPRRERGRAAQLHHGSMLVCLWGHPQLISFRPYSTHWMVE